MFDPELVAQAADILAAARSKGVMLATAESCTGGLVAAVLTAVPGSSDAVFGGTVTYANEAKIALGVPADVLADNGAVSEAVARALAEAARMGALAAGAPRPVIAVAVTGVAGPGGGSAEKPVGLVHFGAAGPGENCTRHREMRFGDIGRDAVRKASVYVAFELLREALR